MNGSNWVTCPNSRTVGFETGTSKFARLKTLNSCAMNSRRWEFPIKKNFREAHVQVGEPGARDRRNGGEAPGRAERVDRVEVEVAAPALTGHPWRQVARVSVTIEIERRCRVERSARTDVRDGRDLRIERQLHGAAHHPAMAPIRDAVAPHRRVLIHVGPVVPHRSVLGFAEGVRDQELIVLAKTFVDLHEQRLVCAAALPTHRSITHNTASDATSFCIRPPSLFRLVRLYDGDSSDVPDLRTAARRVLPSCECPGAVQEPYPAVAHGENHVGVPALPFFRPFRRGCRFGSRVRRVFGGIFRCNRLFKLRPEVKLCALGTGSATSQMHNARAARRRAAARSSRSESAVVREVRRGDHYRNPPPAAPSLTRILGSEGERSSGKSSCVVASTRPQGSWGLGAVSCQHLRGDGLDQENDPQGKRDRGFLQRQLVCGHED